MILPPGDTLNPHKKTTRFFAARDVWELMLSSTDSD
jgi:hypothetical protein